MPDSSQDKNQRHKQRMQRKKSVVDKHIKSASETKGLIVINTGNGKGKSSSAFGMMARALGHGMHVAVVQFIKAADSTGEELFFREQKNVAYHVMGEGFTWDTQDRERDIATAKKAWDKAREFLNDPSFDMVVLDELNIALGLDLAYLDLDTVIADLLKRPAMQHVIITGRGARQELIDIADTVSDVAEVKHAYQAGVQAQKGIEL